VRDMDYSKFRHMVRRRETANVDFKIACDAFQSSSLAPRAELAKDICAMANNGNVASYIIIGVSDDGRQFRSVTNSKLTDDNLQAFCKSAIYPPPRVSVHRERWVRVSAAHAKKDFVIIQIGPHPRQCFRLAKDFISYKEQLCYRRNEVWVRRGATTDLATPEEVVGLARRQRAKREEVAPDIVRYARLPKRDQSQAMRRDLEDCLQEIGGSVHGDNMVVPIRGRRHVWRYSMWRQCTAESAVLSSICRNWRYEHGALLLVDGRVSRSAVDAFAAVYFQEPWGHFASYPFGVSPFEPWSGLRLPVNMTQTAIIAAALPNVGDGNRLRGSLLGLIDFLRTDDEAYEIVRSARTGIDANLRQWLRQGWLMSTGRCYKPAREELAANETFDRRRGEVLRRERSAQQMEGAQRVLDLSAGRVPSSPR
jgi:hypothetical protein